MDEEKSVRGRPFENGNKGRPPGSKNKSTLIAASLATEKGGELLEKAVEVALGGNVPMLKFLLERILPKERTIQFELPQLGRAHDSVDAMARIVEAVSEEQITPREAADLSQIVSAFARSIEVMELEQEVEAVAHKLDDVGSGSDTGETY